MSVRSKKGFTLFEIMVTLAIVGLIMGIVVGGMGRSVDRNMRKTSAHLASTIRYLYNKSALDRLYIRLVFDMDERAYWVEATTDPIVVTKEDELSKNLNPAKKKDEKKPEDAEETAEGAEEEATTTEEGEVEKLKPPAPKFGQVDSYLLKPSKLPEGVFIKDIQVEHKDMPVEGGKESIYFFPTGYVERAIINLRDEKDEINYSLITMPLSGGVKIEDKYRSLKE